MCVRIGERKSRIQPDFRVQPAVAVGWIFQMVLLKEQYVVDQILRPFRWAGEILFPGIKATAPYSHGLAQKLNRKLSGKLQNYLVFLLPNRMYSLSGPSPFTM